MVLIVLAQGAVQPKVYIGKKTENKYTMIFPERKKCFFYLFFLKYFRFIDFQVCSCEFRGVHVNVFMVVHGCSCDIFVVLFKSIFSRLLSLFLSGLSSPRKKLFGSRLSQKSICKIIGYPANRF